MTMGTSGAGITVQRSPDPGCICFRSLLVTNGMAFYNPPNTALDIVAVFIRPPVRSTPPNRTDSHCASECLGVSSHYCISQEH